MLILCTRTAFSHFIESLLLRTFVSGRNFGFLKDPCSQRPAEVSIPGSGHTFQVMNVIGLLSKSTQEQAHCMYFMLVFKQYSSWVELTLFQLCSGPYSSEMQVDPWGLVSVHSSAQSGAQCCRLRSCLGWVCCLYLATALFEALVILAQTIQKPPN